MTPIDTRNDTKVLFAIAGIAVTGAIGLAVLAGWSADRKAAEEVAKREEARSTTIARVNDSRAEAAPPRGDVPDVLSASFDRPSPEPDVTAPVPESVQAEAQAGPRFEIDPDENFVARGLESYESREFDRASAYLLAEIDARPQRAWSHYMLGLSLWKAGQLEEAVSAMEQAAQLDPESIKTFVNLSRIQNDRGQHAAALDASRSALAIDPVDPAALFLEGRSLMNLGQFEEAESSLSASLANAPDNGYVRNMLGLMLIQQDRTDEAAEHLSRAVELVPDVAFIHNNLGMALERSGRADEAVLAYTRAVTIDAGHERAVSNLARLGGPVELPVPETPLDPELEAVAALVPNPEAEVNADDIVEAPGVPEETAESVEVAAVDETPSR